jgi:hypothetical protein
VSTEIVMPVPPMSQPNIEELVCHAASGLVQMLDPETGLFCYRMKRNGDLLVREGVSPRYTAMTLLGLHRLEIAGVRPPLDIHPIYCRLLESSSWMNNIGDLGLMVWLTALASPEHLQKFCSQFAIEFALDRLIDVEDRRTMELAWFLSGLSHAALVGPQVRTALLDPAHRTFELLRQNQGPHGFFGHQPSRRTVGGILRGSIGSFADQVYPIYALAQFGRAYDFPVALDIARNCANAICAAQGPLGQWWWHYHAPTGRVFQRYPIYSVHQYGMAPMSLFALAEATGSDFNEPILRGLSWIGGNNELKRDLRDSTTSAIWRSFYRRGWTTYPSELLQFLWPKQFREPIDDMRILHECRPYCFGWLLYALAGRGTSSL